MKNSKKKGATVTEVTIASAIFLIASVPLISLFQAGNRFSVAGQRRLQAALLANDVLERFQLQVDRSTYASNRLVSSPYVKIEPPSGFRYQLQTLDRSEKGLDKVAVTVRWKEGNKKKGECTLEALVSRSGCRKRVSNFISSSSSISKILGKKRNRW